MSNLLTGLLPLAGVALGALLTPLTQLLIEGNRERRAARRAKLLIRGELLHAELTLRSASDSKMWPPLEDAKVFIPTSAWQENRSSLVGYVSEDLWEQLVITYALLVYDQGRFEMGARLAPGTLLREQEAESLIQTANNLYRLRRKLGGGGAWPDAIRDEFKPPL
jgi:hypothetical protein